MYEVELIGSLKLDNVWVVVQLIHRPTRTKNQLFKNQNIDQLETSSQLWYEDPRHAVQHTGEGAVVAGGGQL